MVSKKKSEFFEFKFILLVKVQMKRKNLKLRTFRSKRSRNFSVWKVLKLIEICLYIQHFMFSSSEHSKRRTNYCSFKDLKSLNFCFLYAVTSGYTRAKTLTLLTTRSPRFPGHALVTMTLLLDKLDQKP